MFAVVYRFYLKPGTELQYIEYWKTVASYFVEMRGALGSTLHKGEDGLWVAYSRWPDKATRKASWPQSDEPIDSTLPAIVKNAIEAIRFCVAEQLPEICLETIEEISSIPFLNSFIKS